MITLKTRFLILACCISTLPLLAIIQAHACSTFLLQSDNCLIVGHNLDEDHAVPGHMILNKRGILKSNISWNEILRGENESDKRVQWISKYGSVTFNSGGRREFPDGGMNEAGLVVCEMSLGNTKYPQDTSRPKMFQMQWIQYLLDNFSSVEGVQKHIDEFELSGMNWHFFVADRKGNKMIVEFLDKQAMVYSNTDIIHPVLCNSTYSSELMHIRSFEGFGGETGIDLSSKEDKNRFVSAAHMIRNYPTSQNSTTVDYGFEILQTLNNSGITKWSIIYDIKNGQVHFRTSLATQMKYIDFSDLDFSCNTPTQVYNLDIQNAQGDISDLMVEYDIIESKKSLKNMWKAALVEEPFLTRFLVKKGATSGMISYAEKIGCKREL